MSQIEYFAHRLHPHHNESNHIFKAGCLFQEYIVDLWAAAEQSCLTWLRNNQKTLCSDVYNGLVDAVAANPDTEAQDLGQRTILPSTLSGSSRNLIQQFQDALAINCHFKGADLFMTVTATGWRYRQSYFQDRLLQIGLTWHHVSLEQR
jgi:hypothetical protein